VILPVRLESSFIINFNLRIDFYFNNYTLLNNFSSSSLYSELSMQFDIISTNSCSFKLSDENKNEKYQNEYSFM
jgi:hypothetical protein